MKRTLTLLLLSTLGLAGCVAVPAYNAPYGGGGYGYGGPAVYVAPPAVVVRPFLIGGGYYYGGPRYNGGRHWR